MSTKTGHWAIYRAFDRCRNGDEINIKLPDDEITIRCERKISSIDSSSNIATRRS